MNNTPLPQNSMKSVIELFSNQFRISISKIKDYEIIDVCGIGSNGAVYTVKSAVDQQYYALKLINLSYYLIDLFQLDLIHFHESAYNKFDYITSQIKSTSYKIRVKSKDVPEYFGSLAEKNSFHREFNALQSIKKNEKTVYLIDYGTLELETQINYKESYNHNIPYVVMPLFKGRLLTEHIEKTMSPIERLLESFFLIEDVIDIISIIHREGIVHRDLYSNNFLYDEDSGKLLLVDFGSALLNFNTELDTKGERRGARRFMSPEQYDNPSSVDYRSDYFFVGSLLFYMLTLVTPFNRDRNAKTLPLKIRSNYIKPEEITESTYSKITKFIDCLLSFSRECRYQSVESIKEECVKIKSSILKEIELNETY